MPTDCNPYKLIVLIEKGSLRVYMSCDFTLQTSVDCQWALTQAVSVPKANIQYSFVLSPFQEFLEVQ